ncbi:MAG: hypothetical protein RLZZ479_1031 [Bacteroidota bacterium]
MIVQSNKGNLSDLIRDFKKFTAKTILEKIQAEPESRREWMLEYFGKSCEHLKNKQNYKVWQNGYHAEHIYSNKFMWSKLDYIHLNHVRAGIVNKASEYIYSSASNYVFDEGLLQITKADNLIIDVLKVIITIYYPN